MEAIDTISAQQSHRGYDAVLLAGDTGASRMVCGRNKSFLAMNGIPLFIYVLRALRQARLINRICIVGPSEQIVRTLSEHREWSGPCKDLLLCEQGESLFHNAWTAFLQLYPEAHPAGPLPPALSEKAVLYISGDIPLVTPFEIDTFLNRCDLGRSDYCLGLAAAEHLSFFRPRRGMPGININFFYVREGRFRQNNLHLVKPLKVANRSYIQNVYDYRYQRDLANIIRLAGEFLKVHVGWKGLWCYGLLHWNQLLCRVRLNLLTAPTRALIPFSMIEQCVSRVLGTRFVLTVTPLAGAVLDIDNEHDYRAMLTMFTLWQQHLAEQEKQLGATGHACQQADKPAAGIG